MMSMIIWKTGLLVYSKEKKSVDSNDMTADMEANKKLSPVVTELLLRGRKLNISLVFISQSYFKDYNTIRLNATLDFIMKIPKQKRITANSIKSFV